SDVESLKLIPFVHQFCGYFDSSPLPILDLNCRAITDDVLISKFFRDFRIDVVNLRNQERKIRTSATDFGELFESIPESDCRRASGFRKGNRIKLDVAGLYQIDNFRERERARGGSVREDDEDTLAVWQLSQVIQTLVYRIVERSLAGLGY